MMVDAALRGNLGEAPCIIQSEAADQGRACCAVGAALDRG